MDRIDTYPEYVKLFREAIDGYAKARFPQGALTTSLILIAEFIDADNEYHLEALSDGKTPPWKLNGMLATGVDILVNPETNFLEDED
jgi:hypothetical protein